MEFNGLIVGSGFLRGNGEVTQELYNFEIKVTQKQDVGANWPFGTAVKVSNASRTYYEGTVYGPDFISSFRIATEFVMATISF
jgi:hypothetical protein